MSAGKGDTRRRSQVPDAEVTASWQRIFAQAVDEIEDDEPPPDDHACNHPAHAWRRCADCKSAFGDLQYQRMKEGEL